MSTPSMRIRPLVGSVIRSNADITVRMLVDGRLKGLSLALTCCLASASTPDNTDLFSSLDIQIDILECRLKSRTMAKGKRLKLNMTSMRPLAGLEFLLNVVGVVKHSLHRVHVVLDLCALTNHVAKYSLSRDDIGQDYTARRRVNGTAKSNNQ